MRQMFLFIALLLPAMAGAQTYSNSPMLVVTPSEEAESPAAAATNIPTATNTPAPAAPVAAPAASSTAGKLWPKDTVPIFMTSCTRFHVERVDACGCIIGAVMQQFAHDEFLKIDEANGLQSHPKMQQIRQDCVNEALAANKRAAAASASQGH